MTFWTTWLGNSPACSLAPATNGESFTFEDKTKGGSVRAPKMIMAANAPILARVGVADGDPVNGYLASGTVAGVIDDRPTCDELVRRIATEAEETLKRLAL